ncbi:MAG: hypothetical protein HDS29_06190 [Bacteroides sp.]|nr:hypothetical protein [Bacteroides sp.]
MSERIKEYKVDYLLTAGECNPEAKMPLPLLVTRVIEVATFHANHLDVGFARLSREGLAWVLSRVSVEMNRWPAVNEPYSLTTWVEDVNRHFSQRNFEIKSGDEVLGYVSSVWMGIDVKKRQSGDLSLLESMRDVISDKRCPVDRFPRVNLRADSPIECGAPYRFRYCDCDFNRHVNTVRYVELLLNEWDLDFYDRHEVKRFDIAFMHEARYGDEVVVARQDDGTGACQCYISRGEEILSKARIIFTDNN